MPYYNPYPLTNPMYLYQNYQGQQSMAQQPQYMINVDGENAAKAWQTMTPPQPNTIIPLFDTDGQHVYFKTYDAYGRMNPLRKGRIVFDDEIQISETAQQPEYVTKQDLASIHNEIEEIKKALQQSPKQNNQNGSNFKR